MSELNQSQASIVATSRATWDIANARTFAIDPVNGSDSNLGYSDGPVGDPATDAAAMAVAKQTLDGFTAIFPLQGAGRSFHLLLARSGSWASGGSVYPSPASGAFNTLEHMDGYVGPTVRAYGAMDNSSLLEGFALAASIGAVSGGYVPMGVPTATGFDFELNGGGAPPFAADDLPKGFYCRFRNIPAVQAALRDVAFFPFKNTTGPANVQISPSSPLPAVPLLTDEFDIEQPGVYFQNFFLRNSVGGGGSSVERIRSDYAQLEAPLGFVYATRCQLNTQCVFEGPGQVVLDAAYATGISSRGEVFLITQNANLGFLDARPGTVIRMGDGASLDLVGGEDGQGLWSFSQVRHVAPILAYGPVKIQNPIWDGGQVVLQRDGLDIRFAGVPTGDLTSNIIHLQERAGAIVVFDDSYIAAAPSSLIGARNATILIPIDTLLATQIRDHNDNLIKRQELFDSQVIAAPQGPAMLVTCGAAVGRFEIVRMVVASDATAAQADTTANARDVWGVTLSDSASGFLLVATAGPLAVRWEDVPAVPGLAYLSEVTAGRAQTAVPPAGIPGGNQKLRLGTQIGPASLFTAFTVGIIPWKPETVPVDSNGLAP